MEAKQALVFGFGEEQEKLCRVLTACGVSPRVVQPEEQNEKIGYLCGMKGYRSTAQKAEEIHALCPLLIFHRFSREDLDPVLDALRRDKLGTQSLKAMVTPTNQNWTLKALLTEVQQEQQVMQGLMKLKRCRDSIPMPAMTDIKLVTALMQAEKLLSGTREVTPEEVEQAYRDLLEAQKR